MDFVNEYENRKKLLRNYMEDRGLDVFFVFNPYNLFYLTRFFHVSTERPVVYAIDREGRTRLLVPALEEKTARGLSAVDQVDVYFEYPGDAGMMDELFASLSGGGQKKAAADSLSLEQYKKLAGLFKDIEDGDGVEQLRLIKSPYEIALLKKAALYADYIVEQGLNTVRPGMIEMELLAVIQQKTIQKMTRELDEIIYVPGGPAGGLVPSGERTSLPHALPSSRVIKQGENMILSCGANVEGYRIECERTFFLGRPGARHREVFDLMVEAQEMAVELMKPGALCRDINNQVLDFIRSKGYGGAIKHRVGHGKGLEEHEKPWIESGDTTALAPGMVVSAEPGIYIDGFAGFRHSDTVLITETGREVLTKIAKDLDSLVV
jgi:Xaa-Pro dipeptidase